MHVNGKLYPRPHPDWAAYSDELFFYTSRYFENIVARLQQISELDEVHLQGYHASELNNAQRFVLAWLLNMPMNSASAREVLHVLEIFHELSGEQEQDTCSSS